MPCAYSDYTADLREEVPDRWWRTFQKLASSQFWRTLGGTDFREKFGPYAFLLLGGW